MIEIAVRDLEEAAGARLVTGPVGRVCRGCAIDSRAVGEDGIFVAFPGERVDGNAFAPQAVAAGAAAVVLTVEPAAELVREAEARGCALLVAEDPTEVLLGLARWYRDRLSCTVVGITGSIGKTTTKDVLAALLGSRFRVHATRGNYNSLIGCPLTILSAPASTEVLVLEMGMNHPGEIARMAACARPSLGVITKVGTSHIGLLGSRENIARAKAELAGGLVADPRAGLERPVLALHGEDDFTPFIVERFAAPAGAEVLRCGTAADDDAAATDVRLGEDGCPVFTLALPGEEPRACRLNIPGAQAVPNALFAAAIAHRLGIPADEIAAGLDRLVITGRRVQVRAAARGARVIDDSYNASPESMAAALDLLAGLPCSGARVAILGEMGELGEEAPRLHALVGAYAAAVKPDLLICVGGALAAEMAASARLMGLDDGAVEVLAGTEDVIARAEGLLGAGDLALVKGSRFVGLDRFVEEVCADAR